MITQPVSLLIQHVATQANITPEEIQKRIKKKLSELSGLISEEGAIHIIANELGVKFDNAMQKLTISGIQAGMRGIEATGKIKQKYETREFNSAKGPGKVANFLLADQTGNMRVVLWNDHTEHMKTLTVGDTIRIKNAYARPNNDRVELHLGHDAKIEQNPAGVHIDVDISTSAAISGGFSTKKIADLALTDQNVGVIATIVQVFEPRFFTVCPECNMRAKEEAGVYTCASHGSVKPSYNYVMNLFLDDGTGNIRCVLWRAQVEQILGKNKEELIAMKDAPGAFEQYKSDLLGVIVKVRGKVQQNTNFGQQELVAYDLEKDAEPEPDITPTVKPISPAQKKEDLIVKEVTHAVMQGGKVTSISTKQESIVSATMPAHQKTTGTKTSTTKNTQQEDDDLFTLDDLEDLEDLDE
jgi:hypothetical protein